MYMSFFFNLQSRYKVESSIYYIQVLLDAVLDISAKQRLDNMGASIESWGTPYLAVQNIYLYQMFVC